MRLMILKRTAALVTVTLALGSLGTAQTPVQRRFGGMINDYTVGVGPWHVLGEWSLTVKGDSGNADVSIALSMVQPTTGASSHTHHVWLTDGSVNPIAGGFIVTGAATITGNGSVAGSMSGSPIEVRVTGGSAVPASNVSVTFLGAAITHFGTAPLEGVVTR